MNTDLSVPDFDYEPEKNRYWTDSDDSDRCLILPRDDGYYKRKQSLKGVKKSESVGKWNTLIKEDF